MTISVEEVTDRRRLASLQAEWQRFVADLPGAEPFGTPAWVTSWLDAFWRDRPIRFLFARTDDRLVGVAPLLVDDAGVFCCRGGLALPVDPVAWRGEIVHVEDGGAVMDAMFDHLDRRGPFRLTMPRLAADSATARTLRAAVDRRRLWGTWREENRTPIIRLPGSLEEYLQSRTRHVRHELRRKQKRLEKAGDVNVRIVDRPEELDAAFADVRAIEARSWKGAAQTSFLDAPNAEDFYRAVFARTADEHWARIYILSLDGRPIAHLFGLVFRNRYYALNSSFDASLGAHSPGAVLILRSVEDACARRLEVFDFMGSEYRWKNEMATEMREHHHVCVFSNFMSSCGVKQVVDQQVKPYVRRHLPVLVQVKRRLTGAEAGAAGTPGEAPAEESQDAGVS